MRHAAVIDSSMLQMTVSMCMCVALQAVASQDYSTADMYSFVIVLWELMAWQIPWGHHNPSQVNGFLLLGSQAYGGRILNR